MNGNVADLYDYATLRTLDVSTMFVPRIARSLLVLGSSQSIDVLDRAATQNVALRRRKGGGGLVLLGPDDLWVDWWIPANDEREISDVRADSLRVGALWRDVLSSRVALPVTVHQGSLEGELEHRVVCFAGKGPGEVFVAGRKAVGVTQWRVREGSFLSTVLLAQHTSDVLSYLREVPEGLDDALDPFLTSELAPFDAEAMVEELGRASGAQVVLHPALLD